MTSASERRRPSGCPSNLRLDEISAGELAAGPDHASLSAHVAECLACRARMAARQADPLLAPDPARFRPLLLAQARRRPARLGRFLGVTGALVGAAAAGIIFWSHGPRQEAAGDLTKGSLALTVQIKRAASGSAAGTIEAVNGEGRLRAGEEMRFTLAIAHAGYAVVLGLDAAPSVTTYVPGAGSDAQPVRVAPPGPFTLPGSVIADDTAGAERVVAIVCQTETPPETLRAKAVDALARSGGHPEAVSSLGTGCLETSVLLRKSPP
jgi:hypothetical protein